MRARYYSPSIGRFITEDPIRDGSNWYSYCGGNPIKYYDWSGLAQEDGSLRTWVNNRTNDLSYINSSISWNSKTSTATVTMSNTYNNTSKTASFKAGVNGAYISNGRMMVSSDILWQTFGTIIDPGAGVDADRDTIVLATIFVVGAKGGGKAAGLAKNGLATTGISVSQATNALTKVENKNGGIAHIMESKHAWNLVGANSWNDVKSVIVKAVTSGVQEPYKNVDKFVYQYKGQVVEVTGKIINGVLNISDAWVKTK